MFVDVESFADATERLVAARANQPLNDPDEWTVRVSAHNGFPRWDGPIETAFEQATWQYEGPLPEAINELVAEPA